MAGPGVEQWRRLVSQYFPPDQVDNALAVMDGESGGDPNQHNTDGEDSRGLLQINVARGASPSLSQYDLFDPETNIMVAAQMYQQRGWQPWTAAQGLGLVEGTKVADPIDDYIAQILGGDVSEPPAAGEPSVTSQPVDARPSQVSASNTTLSDILRVNGTVTSIVPLPQSESQQLAAIMGGAGKEPILRYWFQNGKYVDVGEKTSNVYRGTAVSALAQSQSPAAQAALIRAETEKANSELSRRLSLINIALSDKRIGLEEAKHLADQVQYKIQNELTQRTQDINLRGQNLSVANALTSDVVRGVESALPYIVPAGTASDFSSVEKAYGSGGVAQTGGMRSMPFPYNPMTLPFNTFQKASQMLSHISPAAAAASGGSPFQAPSPVSSAAISPSPSLPSAPTYQPPSTPQSRTEPWQPYYVGLSPDQVYQQYGP